MLENEAIDVIYDLRAEVKGDLPSEKSIHQPIVDEAANQEQSIQKATKAVMDAYDEGKIFISIVIPDVDAVVRLQPLFY